MSPDLAATARAWQAAGVAAVVVTVRAHRGSVPREAGTRMLVAASAIEGTIGGGHLEAKAIATARDALAGRAALPAEQHWPLGPALGQCCGGAVTLGYETLAQARIDSWAAPAPRFALQLHGAGHVGRAIVRLLETLPCRVQWVDEREAEFPAAPSAPHVERVSVDAPEAEVKGAPPGAFFLVLTHSHDLDLRICEAVLARGEFGFFGLIGSATKRARFEHRFAARGVDPALVARLQCPIGLAGLAGKEPEVIAVSVVAQLLLAAGGAGAPGAQTTRLRPADFAA